MIIENYQFLRFNLMKIQQSNIMGLDGLDTYLRNQVRCGMHESHAQILWKSLYGTHYELMVCDRANRLLLLISSSDSSIIRNTLAVARKKIYEFIGEPQLMELDRAILKEEDAIESIKQKINVELEKHKTLVSDRNRNIKYRALAMNCERKINHYTEQMGEHINCFNMLRMERTRVLTRCA